MSRMLPIALSLFVCLSACSTSREAEPAGVIARFGATPTIDGVFDAGEWDDALVVEAGGREQFRIKHDGANLYFALPAGGGEILFDMAEGLRVLHWSAQLGSAQYVKGGTAAQSLASPFDFELWGLWREPSEVIQEALNAYLAENGWVANTASMGNLMQSELAVSFDWLGVRADSDRFVEIPGVRIGAGLMITRDDPRGQELLALPREELARSYPPISWPRAIAARDSIGMRGLPDTVRADPADYGRIRIDLRR